jgi:hypothetical protein
MTVTQSWATLILTVLAAVVVGAILRDLLTRD